MRKVSLRLPEHLVAAYDSADGTRSAVMRRRLVEAVEDGEVRGVDDDLQLLAEAEAAVDRGKLTRRRATFKSRFHDFAAGKWTNGAVTGDDMDDLAESWRDEGALFGRGELEYVAAVVRWYRANYSPHDKPPFPTPEYFVAQMRDAMSVSEPGEDVPDRLVDVAREAVDDGVPRRQVIDRLSTFHDVDDVYRALERAGVDPPDDPGEVDA
jgi:hypothetical protein